MESIIRRRLRSDEELMRLAPSIYYAKGPSDIDEGNYPRLVINLERYADAIHGVSGTAEVEIVCNQTTIEPERIERLVRRDLEGIFLRTKAPNLLKWQKTEVFEEPASERTALVIGQAVTFGIYEYERSELSEPDCLDALALWAQEWGLTVLGWSELPEIFEPTFENPAVYFSLAGLKTASQQANVTWMEANVRVHLFAPRLKDRREWLMAMNYELLNLKAVRMADGSPMRITESNYEASADEITGQMRLTCSFGLMKRRVFKLPIAQKIITNGER